MKTKMNIFLALSILLALPALVYAEITTFTDETAYLNALDAFEYVVVTDDFEGTAWEGVRSSGRDLNIASSVTSKGVTWTSGDNVTTSIGAGRTGYGLFAYEHGVPDSVTGTYNGSLYAVGGWFSTNTPPAKINILLDNTDLVDFDDPVQGTSDQFLGLIDTTGFTTFTFQEMEGTIGDQKYIFVDDVSFAPAPLNYTGIQITEISSNINDSVVVGQPFQVTVSAISEGPVPPIYYQFFYRAGYGLEGWGGNPWIGGEWGPVPSTSFSFDTPGIYFVVVHCEYAGNSWGPGDPQAGFVVEVTEGP